MKKEDSLNLRQLGEEGAMKKTKKRQAESDDNSMPTNETSPTKKRLIWTPELQRKFQVAVKELGDKAIPKLILESMKEEGITRQQVASHLQVLIAKTKLEFSPFTIVLIYRNGD